MGESAFLVGQVFNGFSVASLFVLAALGLALSFGLMRVINMAHGEMLMLGGYLAYMTLSGRAGSAWHSHRVAGGLSWARGWLGRCWNFPSFTGFPPGRWIRCWRPGASVLSCSRRRAICSAPSAWM